MTAGPGRRPVDRACRAARAALALARRGARRLDSAYLPPLMVYLAAGVSGLTSIVGTFFVKEHLGLSAAVLASLGFWATLPWVLKVPLGHLVDLYWRHKHLLVWAGAALIAASLLAMIGLLAAPTGMARWATPEAWYVFATMLGAVGYVMQDVVADAMTVEAVPKLDRAGRPIDEARRAAMHTTMQTLGRMAILGGGLLVSIVNVTMLRGVEDLTPAERVGVYVDVHLLALAVPLISVLGVVLARSQQRRARTSLVELGMSASEAARGLSAQPGRPRLNPWMLGGGAAFAAVSLVAGLSDVPWGQEALFVASMAIIGALMARLLRDLPLHERRALLATALVIWVYRATPLPGPALTWWMVDGLGFDEAFLAKLSLIGGVLGIVGLVLFRRFMAERPVHVVLGVLTVASTALMLPFVGMTFGLHEWTAARTGGLVDARFIALANTALESPLSQIATVPMLAWVARYAPDSLKATYFAVMLSFSNLALQASQLGAKWLNRVFVVSREVRDDTGAVTVAADYASIDALLVTTTALGLVLPLAAIGAAVAADRAFARRRVAARQGAPA
jgi:hypothetical protein